VFTANRANSLAADAEKKTDAEKKNRPHAA
jgi:hypothetical protein